MCSSGNHSGAHIPYIVVAFRGGLDEALAVRIEDPQPIGDRRESLVDRVAAVEEAMLRTRSEHAIWLRCSFGHEIVN